MRNNFREFGYTLAAVAGLVLVPGAVTAAPQALALIATENATVLNCQGGECSAEFSSFCLQQDRKSPVRGTAYNLIGKGQVALIGTTRDGGTVALDTPLSFESLRTHVAVRISVSQSVMQERELTSIAIRVGDNVTLAPVPVAGDDNPQDDAGLALASGPLRKIGTNYVDSNDTRMAAARLTSRLINGIEPGASYDGDSPDLWQRSVGDASSIPARVQAMAKGALKFCRFAVERRGISNIKGCLQDRHDKFIGYLNGAYWNASGAGS